MRHLIERLFSSPSLERRPYFYAVDLVRGICAIIVVVFHYRHFNYGLGDYILKDSSVITQQPAYWVIWPIYEHGHWAVQLFWGISGFVFANVYAGKQITGRDFFVRRLARLYPLHLLTLIIVCILQIFAYKYLGTYLVYEYNDIYHFLLNVFMVSNWGLEAGFSFNAPIWSVSVELVAYAIFWLLLPWLFRCGILFPSLVILLAPGFYLINPDLAQISYCVICFFIGVNTNYFVTKLSDEPEIILATAIVASGLFCLIVYATVTSKISPAAALPILIIAVLCWASTFEMSDYGKRIEKLRFIGDSTYGIYLWHFPIQLIIIMILDLVIGSRIVVSSVAFLMFFVVIVCLIGWISFRTYETWAGALILRALNKSKIS